MATEAYVPTRAEGDALVRFKLHRAANIPQPNVIAINPTNRHGHASYLLAIPVARHRAARTGPLRFFAAVERGIARRIGADRRYCGLISKNPLHPDWRVNGVDASPTR